jgi:general secretion pathway protein K
MGIALVMTTPRRERGIAAIVAILVVALATSAATYMLWYQSLAMRHVENITARAQADAVARAGGAWAAAILNTDNRNVDHLGEIWAQTLPPFEAESATLAGGIEDEQGKFNLNGLVGTDGKAADAAQVAAFGRLLTALQLPSELANAVVDWIDADQETTQPGGAEDVHYLTLDPPYRAANSKLADPSELRRVKGFTDEYVTTLSKHVTALPVPTKVNVNTASAEVLEAVIAGINRSLAQQIVEARKSTPFNKIEDLQKVIGEDVAKAAIPMLDVKSSYFGAHATVLLGRVTVSYRGILDRSQPGWPRIIALYGESL